MTLRRGSAPTALHPVNWLDSGRCKRGADRLGLSHLGRHSSLRLAKYDGVSGATSGSASADVAAPGFRRRGSLPYELGRKLSNNEAVASRRLQVADSAKLSLRRGSAPCDLLRNTSTSIASCWIQFRDRVKMKVSIFVFLSSSL